jgi:hypothetical protein
MVEGVIGRFWTLAARQESAPFISGKQILNR